MRARLIGIALLAFAGGVLAAGLTRGAEETGRPVARASGAIESSNSRLGEAILNAHGMGPGDAVSGQVTVQNQGEGRASFTLAQERRSEAPGLGGGRLYDSLLLEVREPGGKPALVYSGPIGALGPTDLGAFDPGEARTFNFRAALPAGGSNGFQQADLSVDFSWTARAAGGSAERCRIGERGDRGTEAIEGTSGGDRIVALGGDDIVRAGDGPDCVKGGRGKDFLAGGAGPDRLRGGPGADRIRGGAGDDTLSGDSGSDRISGGPGSDRISCGPGLDFAYLDSHDPRPRGCERIRG